VAAKPMSDGYHLKHHGHYKGPSESEHDLVHVGKRALRHAKDIGHAHEEIYSKEGKRSMHGQQQGMFHKEHLMTGFKVKPHEHA
jgi:hypothetical protein